MNFDPVASDDASTSDSPAFASGSRILQEDDARPAARSREGLPSAYRMRHGRHYVEQLMGDAPLRTVREIAIADIEPPESDGADITDLVQSVRAVGVLQPLLVSAQRGRYHLIAGENRFRAAQAAGLRTIPCLVHDLDGDALEWFRTALKPRASSRTAATGPQSTQHTPEANRVTAAPEAAGDLGYMASLMAALNAAGDDTFRRALLTDLIGVEAQRRCTLTAARRILSQSQPLHREEIEIGPVIDGAIAAVSVEARLRNVAIGVHISDPRYRIPADRRMLTTAIKGLLNSGLALAGAGGAVRLVADGTSIRPALILDLSQDSVAIGDGVVSRFFEADWSEHPCGTFGSVMLASAALSARLHGGRTDVDRHDGVGCTIRFVIPRHVDRRKQRGG